MMLVLEKDEHTVIAPHVLKGGRS